MSLPAPQAWASASSSSGAVLEPPRVSLKQWAGRGAVTVVVIVALAWSYRGAEVRPGDLIQHSGNMFEYVKGFLHPDFTRWRMFTQQMLVTIQIAIWGTFLAMVLAVPAGLLCASNVAPPWIYHPMRRLMDAMRAINEMIFALIFFVAVGPGPFAGVLALFVHTLGTLAKLFSEAVESCDARPVEGIRATGASALDEVRFGIIPQVLPLWISYALYRFEANVRSASVVGMVGAGGIGVILHEVIRGFDYAETAAVLLIIIVSVTLIDLLSARIRQWAI